jgi:hypothetical protein
MDPVPFLYNASTCTSNQITTLESHPPSIALLSDFKVLIVVIPLINYLITIPP